MKESNRKNLCNHTFRSAHLTLVYVSNKGKQTQRAIYSNLLLGFYAHIFAEVNVENDSKWYKELVIIKIGENHGVLRNYFSNNFDHIFCETF